MTADRDDAGAGQSPRRPVVLVGPPASGKTTLARLLAARRGVPAADTDERVVADAGGASVRELFAREGEEGFRARERRALGALLDEGRAGVIATGGGTLLDRALRHAVLRRAVVIALRVPRAVLLARALDAPAGARPLLAGEPAAIEARLDRLLEARAAAYAEAHATVDLAGAAGEGGDAVAACEAALAELEAHPALVVPLGARTYRVHVAPLATLGPAVARLAPSAVVLVTDARVARRGHVRAARLEGALAPARVVTLPGRGDRDKTLASVKRVWDAALAAAIDRDALLVGIGGGVVTDLTGFAAATLLRGVRYASAPTTLLAMVDASVGGKTGFDHARGKNLIGAFHQPALVVCDPAALATLPARDVRAGLAEVAKVALACDRALFDRLAAPALAARLAAGELAAIAAVLPDAIQAKIDVVARDEREAGERAVLNFGHTVGHALEQGSGYALPHGECVAVGMRAALWLGARLGVTPPAVAAAAHEMLDALGLPRRAPPRSVDSGAARAALALDKKRRGRELRFVLCAEVGASVVRPVDAADALAALESVLETRTGPSRRVALK